jgi:mRNA interferase MazF
VGKFVKGDVVVVPFPFSDLSSSKRRPALVLAVLEGGDCILCQITSQTHPDSLTIPLNDSDFASGGLQQPSFIRPNHVFTAEGRIILYRAGSLKSEKWREVISSFIRIFGEH